MKDISYDIITKKYKEFFFPMLFIAMSKYLTTFVDSALVSSFLGVERMPAINICFPVVCFVGLFHGMLGIGALGHLRHKRHVTQHIAAIHAQGEVGTILAHLSPRRDDRTAESENQRQHDQLPSSHHHLLR